MLVYSNLFKEGIGPNTPQLAINTRNNNDINPTKKIFQKIVTLFLMMIELGVKMKTPQIKYHIVISKLIKYTRFDKNKSLKFTR